jgi:hypothetical protein
MIHPSATICHFAQYRLTVSTKTPFGQPPYTGHPTKSTFFLTCHLKIDSKARQKRKNPIRGTFFQRKSDKIEIKMVL